MQFIFDPISKSITIIDGLDVDILPGPFKDRQDAILAATEHVSLTAKNGTGRPAGGNGLNERFP